MVLTFHFERHIPYFASAYSRLAAPQVSTVSCLRLPPRCRSSGNTGMCYPIWLYVTSEELNLGPHTTESLPSLIIFIATKDKFQLIKRSVSSTGYTRKMSHCEGTKKRPEILTQILIQRSNMELHLKYTVVWKM